MEMGHKKSWDGETAGGVRGVTRVATERKNSLDILLMVRPRTECGLGVPKARSSSKHGMGGLPAFGE